MTTDAIQQVDTPNPFINIKRGKHENSLANLKPFKPGEVHNPAGRPKKEFSITSKVKLLLEHEVDAIAQRVVKELVNPLKEYPTALLNTILDRTEGKLSSGFSMLQVTDIDINVTFEQPKALQEPQDVVEGEISQAQEES